MASTRSVDRDFAGMSHIHDGSNEKRYIDAVHGFSLDDGNQMLPKRCQNAS